MRRIVITPVSSCSSSLAALASALGAQREHFDEWRVWADEHSIANAIANANACGVSGDWARVGVEDGAYRTGRGLATDDLRVEPCFKACADENCAYLLVADTCSIGPNFVKTMFERVETRKHAVVYANVDDAVAEDVVVAEPRALDAFAWAGSELVSIQGRVPLDAVEFLGRTLPVRVGRPNLVCAAARCWISGAPEPSQPEPVPVPEPTQPVPEPAQPEPVSEPVPEPTQPVGTTAETPEKPIATPETTTPPETTAPEPPSDVPPAAPQKKRVTRRRAVNV